jgi:hypothetical protein
MIMFGCGGSKSEQSQGTSDTESTAGNGESSEPKSINEAMNQMEDAVKQMQGSNELKEPVNFRDLKDLIPESALRLKRTDLSGETSGVFGMKFSQARANFSNDSGDKSVDMEVMDFGGVGPALMGMATWVSVEIDRESGGESERTTKIKGFKAYEKYNKNDKTGELSVFVSERFLVKISGQNVTIDELKSALDAFDFDKLKKLG